MNPEPIPAAGGASSISTFWIRGNAHRYTIIGVYVGGIWIAGLLTLLPGRLLHRAAFGS